jgi:hypothetical protein
MEPKATGVKMIRKMRRRLMILSYIDD